MPRGDALGDVVTDMLTRHGQSITLVRASAALAAQTFLVDMYGGGASAGNETAMVEAASGEAGRPIVKLYGTAASDVARGDRFVLDSVQYRVIVVVAPDSVQRIAYAQGDQP